MKGKQVKLAGAVIGASAVILGGAGVAMTEPAAATDVDLANKGLELTLGETTTEETGDTEIETPAAEPEVEVELPDGYGP